MVPVSIIVVGAGQRGSGYARWARQHPERASVVAVADHQVVALEFPGATTATFTMTAFSRAAPRSTRLFGTPAELAGDGRTIRVYDFLARAERLITPAPANGVNADGHDGGDAGLMDALTAAVATGDRALIKSGPRESLASHLAVFAAERSRLNGTVETIPLQT